MVLEVPEGQHPDLITWHSENFNSYDPQTGVHTAQPVSPVNTESLRIAGFTAEAPRNLVTLAGTLEMDTRAGDVTATSLPRRSQPAEPVAGRQQTTPGSGRLPPRPGSRPQDGAAPAASSGNLPPRPGARDADSQSRRNAPRQRDKGGFFGGSGAGGRDGVNAYRRPLGNGRGNPGRGARGRGRRGGRGRRPEDELPEDNSNEIQRPVLQLRGRSRRERNDDDASENRNRDSDNQGAPV